MGILLCIVFERERKAIRLDEEAKERKNPQLNNNSFMNDSMSHCAHLPVGACMAMQGSYPPPHWLKELPHSPHLIVCGGEGLTQPPLQIGLPLGGGVGGPGFPLFVQYSTDVPQKPYSEQHSLMFGHNPFPIEPPPQVPYRPTLPPPQAGGASVPPQVGGACHETLPPHEGLPPVLYVPPYLFFLAVLFFRFTTLACFFRLFAPI